MPCWNKEKGSKIIEPDDGGDDVFCHVRDPKDGEGRDDNGDITKPKVFLQGHVGHISHSDSEAGLRVTSSTSSMLHDGERRGNSRGSLRCRCTPVSRSNGAGASSRPRRKRNQDSVCRQSRSFHEALQNMSDVASWECTQHGKCWRAVESGTGRHEEEDRRTSRCDSENVDTFKQVKSLSARDACAREPCQDWSGK